MWTLTLGGTAYRIYPSGHERRSNAAYDMQGQLGQSGENPFFTGAPLPRLRLEGVLISQGTYVQTATSETYPRTVDQIDLPAEYWPANFIQVGFGNLQAIKVRDGVTATAVWEYNNFSTLLGEPTALVRSSNFGFSIPSDAVVTGLQATLRISGAFGILVIRVLDNTLTLAGNNLSAMTPYSTRTLQDIVFGGLHNTWGVALTPAMVNAANFGIAFALIDQPNFGTQIVNVDSISLKLWYNAMSTSSAIMPALLGAVESGESVTLTNDRGTTYSGPLSEATIRRRVLNSPDFIAEFSLEMVVP